MKGDRLVASIPIHLDNCARCDPRMYCTKENARRKGEGEGEKTDEVHVAQGHACQLTKSLGTWIGWKEVRFCP